MTDKSIPTFDMVIMGGGLVGSALALALKDANLRIALVDIQQPASDSVPTLASETVNDFEPRVSALTLASVNQLSEIGVWQQVFPALAQPYQKMHVWDELGTAHIQFDALEMQCNELGYIVENKHLVMAMHQALKTQSNVTCFWGEGLKGFVEEEGRSRLFLEQGELLCSLLVGADGANSRVRQLASLPTREWDYEHQAIVCTVQTEGKHQGIARQRFSEMGPLAFLPLMDGKASEHFCSIVWSLASAEAKTLLDLDDSAFSEALRNAIEDELGAILSVSKRVSFPLRQRHAKAYVNDRVALAGDAAHTIHPLAGQGVNLGFKDVAVLSRLIAEASSNDLPVNHPTLLRRYQRERQGDNLLMMGAMEGFKQLFGGSDPMLRWLRNTGLGFVNKQAFIKNQLAKHAMGIQ